MDDVFNENYVDVREQSESTIDAANRRQQESDDSWRNDDDGEIRRGAEAMLHYLLVQSKNAALLIAHQWLPDMVSPEFQHENIFRDVAERGGCVLHKQSRPENGGMRHMLFM